MSAVAEADLAAYKVQQRAVWSAGDYASIDHQIAEVGELIVARLTIGSDEEVLDVACGAGNATIPAARRARSVVGVDLVPELLDAGRSRAAAAGVEVEWLERDAEALPFPDDRFDVVVSTFGCMFAPRHRVAAAEIGRVLRPGGRVGICSWTPEGHIGDFVRVVGGHLPAPPAFAEPPALWGSDEYVRQLFAGTGVEIGSERAAVELRFESVEAGVEEFATKFGPIVVARALLEPEGRWTALRDDLAALFERINQASDGSLAYEGEYLITLGHKAT